MGLTEASSSGEKAAKEAQRLRTANDMQKGKDQRLPANGTQNETQSQEGASLGFCSVEVLAQLSIAAGASSFGFNVSKMPWTQSTLFAETDFLSLIWKVCFRVLGAVHVGRGSPCRRLRSEL